MEIDLKHRNMLNHCITASYKMNKSSKICLIWNCYLFLFHVVGRQCWIAHWIRWEWTPFICTVSSTWVLKTYLRILICLGLTHLNGWMISLVSCWSLFFLWGKLLHIFKICLRYRTTLDFDILHMFMVCMHCDAFSDT